MDILIGFLFLAMLAGGCGCILWLSKNSRARAYRLAAAWALSNADACDERVKRRAVYMAEAV